MADNRTESRFNHNLAGSGPKIISVLSGKGGVGKTVIAFNLAERIAALGYRTLLVDGDFACGNLHIMANVAADFGLEQYAGGELSLAEAVTSIGDHLNLLPVFRKTGLLEPICDDSTARLFERLRSDSTSYDFVMLDHSSGVSKTATVAAHASDINLLVLVPELTSISDCYGLYKHLIETNKSIDCRLIINRAASDEERDYIYGKFAALTERFLGCPIPYFDCLLESEAVRKSIAGQIPIAQMNKQEAIKKTLTAISRKLTKTLLQPTETPVGYKGKTMNEPQAAADIRE